MINEVKERLRKPSPKFFKRITNFCLILGGIGTVLVTAPVALPVGLVTIGGYLLTAGAIGGAVSKLTVDKDKEKDEQD